MKYLPMWVWRGAHHGVRRDLLLAAVTRLARALCTGGLAALVQLGLLSSLTHQHWGPTLADAMALVLGAQVNFGLSYGLVWRDRRPRRGAHSVLLRQWSLSQGVTGVTIILNLLVFAGARHVLPLPAAALAGTAVAALGNFVLNDRLVFRVKGTVAACAVTDRRRAHCATEERDALDRHAACRGDVRYEDTAE